VAVQDKDRYYYQNHHQLHHQQLRREIKLINKVIVHGGGYVGLTGAIHLALAGYQVIIYDPDGHTVKTINEGKPRAGEYLDYIDADVKVLVKDNKLLATQDYESIKHEKIHLLAVPTEKGDEPYMGIVKDCILKLHTSIPHEGLIIIESTLKPGTVDELYLPRVHKKDIFLAVCPRLDWFGDKEKNVTTLPRIIGGVTEESRLAANELLTKICKDIRFAKSHREAEFAKAGQNALYFVQIMTAYQLAKLYQNDADMNEVLRLIGVHWRLPQLFLGPGTSGRCVAMGAKYLYGDNDFHFTDKTLLRCALDYDKRWRRIIADRVTHEFPFAAMTQKILVMGIAYRPDFSDFGYSAGLDIAKYLKEYGWDTYINDPIIPKETLDKLNVPTGIVHNDLDAIILATGHSAYSTLPETWHFMKKGLFILDCCGLWERYRTRFETYGLKYKRVGEKGWLENQWIGD
jgi:UDP-N-acetyl-D-glucosamine dehydrogenase